MNELQTILTETCTRLFTDHATTAVLEGAEKGAWPTALWQARSRASRCAARFPLSTVDT